jgi:hypothetical protein
MLFRIAQARDDGAAILKCFFIFQGKGKLMTQASAFKAF